MKEKIFYIINQIVELLENCNLGSKADWFRSKAKELAENDFKSERFAEELLSIKKIIGGIGSFSDLPMYPKKNVNLSNREARKLQWQLSEQLDKEITNLLEERKRYI